MPTFDVRTMLKRQKSRTFEPIMQAETQYNLTLAVAWRIRTIYVYSIWPLALLYTSAAKN